MPKDSPHSQTRLEQSYFLKGRLIGQNQEKVVVPQPGAERDDFVLVLSVIVCFDLGLTRHVDCIVSSASSSIICFVRLAVARPPTAGNPFVIAKMTTVVSTMSRWCGGAIRLLGRWIGLSG